MGNSLTHVINRLTHVINELQDTRMCQVLYNDLGT